VFNTAFSSLWAEKFGGRSRGIVHLAEYVCLLFLSTVEGDALCVLSHPYQSEPKISFLGFLPEIEADKGLRDALE